MLITGAAAVVGFSSLAGAGMAAAHGDGGPVKLVIEETSLVDRLAERFKLDKEEVQKVFDEERGTHELRHRQAISDKLEAAVEDGDLTQEQADLINAKHTELQSQKESLEEKTPKERREAMEDKREELTAWAEENDIPTQYVLFGPQRGGEKFKHRMYHN